MHPRLSSALWQTIKPIAPFYHDLDLFFKEFVDCIRSNKTLTFWIDLARMRNHTHLIE